MKPEYRAGLPAEFREEDGQIKISGYAAVFNQEADIGGMFREVIRPGAFSKAVSRDDVVLLVNHEGLPLARTSSGTLTLKEDERGLHISAGLDSSDPDVQQLAPKLRRGDISKMSFAFLAEREEWDETGDTPLRAVLEAKLFDVSPVTKPAYSGTEVGLRSLEAHRNEQVNHAAIQSRMRMKLAIADSPANPAEIKHKQESQS